MTSLVESPIQPIIMPVYCEGLPDGPCPKQRHDRTVTIGTGDLMLCRECDAERRRQEAQAIANARRTSTSSPATCTTVGNVNGSSTTSQLKRTTATISAVALRSGSKSSPAPRSSNNKQSVGEVSTATRYNNLVINELLTYVTHYFNSSETQPLRQAVLASFSPPSIAEAKRLLIQCYQSILGTCPYTADRRNSPSRPLHEAEVDDILAICCFLSDTQPVHERTTFVASNLDILPKLAPDESILTVSDITKHTDTAVELIITSVQQFSDSQKATFCQIQDTLNTIQQNAIAITTALKSSNSQNKHQNTSITPPQQSSSRIGERSPHVDRSLNVIMFGVPEDRDAQVWRQNVDEIFEHLLNRRVEVADTFRLGRYNNNNNSNKARPILVKLKTAWDKRLLLTKSRELRNSTYANVFIVADEPLEVRRKQALGRLKYKATQSGRRTDIVNNVLFVDGKAVFSLANGSVDDDDESILPVILPVNTTSVNSVPMSVNPTVAHVTPESDFDNQAGRHRSA